MTLFTRHSGVQTDQRELGHVVIERDFLSPTRFIVAGLALRAELAFVRIVALVASDACGGELILIKVTLMAAIAFDGFVRVAQRELGVLVVIEADGFPFFRRVAGLALLPVAASVDVLQLMAINAGVRQILVALADMTSGAFDVFVRAFERKLGL